MGVMNNKGIPYSDDLDCSQRLVKYHTTGYKNIYSLRIVYIVTSRNGQNGSRKKKKQNVKQRVIRLDYGNYSAAITRFRLEGFMDNKSPTRMKPERMDIVIETYNGEELVNEELMISRFLDEMKYVEYNPNKYYGYE